MICYSLFLTFSCRRIKVNLIDQSSSVSSHLDDELLALPSPPVSIWSNPDSSKLCDDCFEPIRRVFSFDEWEYQDDIEEPTSAEAKIKQQYNEFIQAITRNDEVMPTKLTSLGQSEKSAFRQFPDMFELPTLDTTDSTQTNDSDRTTQPICDGIPRRCSVEDFSEPSESWNSSISSSSTDCRVPEIIFLQHVSSDSVFRKARIVVPDDLD